MIAAPTTPFPLHQVTLYNGCRMAYIDEGNGPETLLFIHGLATYGLSWRKNIESLRSRYRCIAIDLPGNGYSAGGNYPYSIGFFAQCLIDFIGRLGLKDVCLVGHSMGGQVAMAALHEAPGCAGRVVLCAPAGFETFTEMDRMLYEGSLQYSGWLSTDEYNLQQTIRSSFYQFPKSAEVMIHDLVGLMRRQPGNAYRDMLDKCISGMLREPVTGIIKQIRQPVLVLFGVQDALIPNRMLHPLTTQQLAMQVTRSMHNATLHMIPQCGHFLQWEKPAVVNRLIRDWLSNKNDK